MVEAEFGQNLRIWKKCIKMVYRESKSFFSKPKLYQPGIFLFVVLLSSYISAVIKLEHKVAFIIFSKWGSNNLFILCLAAILKVVSQDTWEWVNFSAPAFSHLFAEDIWELFKASMKAGILFCSPPCSQHWKTCLAQKLS